MLLEVQKLGNVTAGLPAALVRCSAFDGQVLRPFICLRLRLPDQAPAKERSIILPGVSVFLEEYTRVSHYSQHCFTVSCHSLPVVA